MCSTSRRWTSPSLSIMSVHENVEVIEVLYRATEHSNNKCDAGFVCSHLLRRSLQGQYVEARLSPACCSPRFSARATH
jgi:hypothetical protein